ncbi:hypothetical protein GCM10012288_22810 [Malaciobacter pacificus]|uniref:Lipocalin domain-containing protein n=1 Tax=Malaciobacter pacificus TaxID=1080223 RepID=A0A5C2H5T8_9BACT|nr:lipocalin family protein [Malaciobacter pacificus]QEP34317.1 lipocalin domain-containing protein [Malaciobacter pacificus]GGD48009.1 hypothetical protein GCM10012288_22810 [Malaciobacter pacificus]
MKFLIFIIMSLSTLNANTSLIDIKKFSGLWYEIARIDNSFQTSCVASSVEYILEDDKYDVYNRCFDSTFDGKLIEYNGSATLENNRLKMRYFLFFTAQYNIEYTNNYKTALVVNDDYSNAWIMSRTPSIDKKELNKILKLIENKIDKSKLIFTKLHPKGKYK